jgi:hypothetical protein
MARPASPRRAFSSLCFEDAREFFGGLHMCLCAWQKTGCGNIPAECRWVAPFGSRHLGPRDDDAQGRRKLRRGVQHVGGYEHGFVAERILRILVPGCAAGQPQQVHGHLRLAQDVLHPGHPGDAQLVSDDVEPVGRQCLKVVEHVPDEVELREIHVLVDRAQDIGGAHEAVVAARMNSVEPVAEGLGPLDLEHDRAGGRARIDDGAIAQEYV